MSDFTTSCNNPKSASFYNLMRVVWPKYLLHVRSMRFVPKIPSFAKLCALRIVIINIFWPTAVPSYRRTKHNTSLISSLVPKLFFYKAMVWQLLTQIKNSFLFMQYFVGQGKGE